MRRAEYVVIRYIADPGRNEPLNVGIVVWDDRGYRLRVDREAVARVIRDHPHLERDALLYLEPALHQQLPKDASFSARSMDEWLDQQKGFPVLFSDARLTTVDPLQPDGLDQALDRLIDRVVRPRRRTGGYTGSPYRDFARRLRPLIYRRLIYQDYVLQSQRTGLPWAVDFFANSGKNLVLDTLALATHKADQIRQRAAAEAFKLDDIGIGGSVVPRCYVFCSFLPDEELSEANDGARRILEAVGATVVTDLDETVKLVQREVMPIG